MGRTNSTMKITASKESRVLRTLYLLVSNSFAIEEALAITADCCVDVDFQNSLRRIAKSVEAGENLGKAISKEESSGLFSAHTTIILEFAHAKNMLPLGLAEAARIEDGISHRYDELVPGPEIGAVAFLRLLGTLVYNFECPYIRALETMKSYVPEEIATAVLKKVLDGQVLSNAFREHPSIFSHLDCELVSIGEQIGSLNVFCQKAADIKEAMLIYEQRIDAPTLELYTEFEILSSLINEGGQAVLPALGMMKHALRTPERKEFYRGIVDEIDGGATLSEVAAARSDDFSPLVIKMIEYGEKSGTIDECFAQTVALMRWDLFGMPISKEPGLVPV